jgi:hypothetical protein
MVSGQKSPPSSVHPVVALALRHLVKPAENSPYRIDRDDLSRVRDALARLSGSDLHTAVKGLIELAFFLDSAKHSPDAAAALLMIAESAAERRSIKIERTGSVAGPAPLSKPAKKPVAKKKK